MTPENFCYWLQGKLELDPGAKTLDEGQVAMIRAHLGYVFDHPSEEKPAPEGRSFTEEEKAKLKQESAEAVAAVKKFTEAMRGGGGLSSVRIC